MRHMIFGSDGDAIGAYRSRRAAVATLRAMLAADPDIADELVLISYDEAGRSVGESIKASDLPPLVTISESRFVFSPEAVTESRAKVTPRARKRNAYIALGGPTRRSSVLA